MLETLRKENDELRAKLSAREAEFQTVAAQLAGVKSEEASSLHLAAPRKETSEKAASSRLPPSEETSEKLRAQLDEALALKHAAEEELAKARKAPSGKAAPTTGASAASSAELTKLQERLAATDDQLAREREQDRE